MFDHQSSMNDTMAPGGEGVSLVGLLALGLCTIAVLSIGSAVSSALITPFRQCPEIETPQESSGPGVRICVASSLSGD